VPGPADIAAMFIQAEGTVGGYPHHREGWMCVTPIVVCMAAHVFPAEVMVETLRDLKIFMHMILPVKMFMHMILPVKMFMHMILPVKMFMHMILPVKTY